MGLPAGESTVTEIAKAMGISASTVSRALRNLPGVREATRENILRVAREHGYRPGDRAGSSRTGRPVNVLALSHGIGSPIDRDYLAGISSSAVELGYNLISHLYRPGQSDQVLDPRYQPRAMAAGEIDAIILIHRWDEAILRELLKKFLVVSIVHQYPGLDIDVIKSNDSQGIDTLVAHFLEQKSKRIGFFGACGSMSWARTRLGAFVESFELRGIAYDPQTTVRVSLEEALSVQLFTGGPALAQAAELTRDGVDAWVCASQLTAASLLNHLLRAGFAVPQAVRLAGYHGTTESTVLGLPVLTTTNARSEEMGSAALRRIQHRLTNRHESMRVIALPCTLLPGATS
jgi:LacI family transcriptional regulator